MIIEVENREDKLINNLVLLWESSVKSTHLFLSTEEIDNIKKYVIVNEQNPNTISFYEYLGFVTYKRSKLDEQGNSYPILYMKCKR